MNKLILIPFLISSLVTAFLLPIWIEKCKKNKMLLEDMNKYGSPKNVATSGGLLVVAGFTLGVLFYVALSTFYFGGKDSSLEIFALFTTILILGIVGLIDDLWGWKTGGLSNTFRLGLAFVAAIPLMVINAGTHSMSFPIIGAVEFGILYPLVLIPLGIAGATTTYNFLAGFNGLEAGQGILIISFLSYVSYVSGSPWLAIVGLCMVSSLVVFFLFNRFPAKVFPGDILTYSVGALVAIMAILGNYEKIAVIVFMPYIFETGLKLRGKLNKYSFGIPDKTGNLKLPYKKIYSLNHLAILVLNKFGNANEKKVTYVIYSIQIVFIFLAFLAL